MGVRIHTYALARRVGVAILALAAAWYVVCAAPLPFVGPWWRSGEANWNDPLHKRHRIADWLILSRALIGKPRSEITKMLGEAPSTGYFKGWDMVYNLGAERGFLSIDSEWLVMRIDKAGVVSEASIVRD